MADDPAPDFFDVARPVLQEAAERLEAEGLTVPQIADAMLACALSLAVGSAGPECVSSVLSSLAAKYRVQIKREAREARH